MYKYTHTRVNELYMPVYMACLHHGLNSFHKNVSKLREETVLLDHSVALSDKWNSYRHTQFIKVRAYDGIWNKRFKASLVFVVRKSG